MKKYFILMIVLGLSFQFTNAETKKSDRQVMLEKSLMAPCCYGGAIYDHESGIAFEMKDEIAQMVKDGKSDKEILSFYEGKYGEKILASPKAEGFNLAAWYVPIAIGVIALLIFVIFMIRSRKSSEMLPEVEHENKEPALNSVDDLIEKELDALR